jgi:hypothetical protein
MCEAYHCSRDPEVSETGPLPDARATSGDHSNE